MEKAGITPDLLKAIALIQTDCTHIFGIDRQADHLNLFGIPGKLQELLHQCLGDSRPPVGLPRRDGQFTRMAEAQRFRCGEIPQSGQLSMHIYDQQNAVGGLETFDVGFLFGGKDGKCVFAEGQQVALSSDTTEIVDHIFRIGRNRFPQFGGSAIL